MKPTTDTPYTDRAVVLASQAVSAAIPKLNSLYQTLGFDSAIVKVKVINGVNAMRESGLALQAACGHEVMSRHFWDTHFEGKLEYDFETAKHFMGVARKQQRKAETLAEAFPFTQLMLVADGLLELPKREEAQVGAAVSPVQKLFNDFTGFRQQLTKIVNVRPLEEWEPRLLEQFLDDSEWFDQVRTKAKKLLEGRK